MNGMAIGGVGPSQGVLFRASTVLGQLQVFKVDDTHIGITAGAVANNAYDGSQVIEVSGAGEIFVSVVADTPAENFSALEIFDNGLDGVTADPTHCYLLIGQYSTTDGTLTVNPMVAGSVALSACRVDPDTGNLVPQWGGV